MEKKEIERDKRRYICKERKKVVKRKRDTKGGWKGGMGKGEQGIKNDGN